MIWRIARILFFLLSLIPIVLEALIAIIIAAIKWITTGEDYLDTWIPLVLILTIKVDEWMKDRTSAGNVTKNSQTTS
jgi:hypothetical protein